MDLRLERRPGVAGIDAAAWDRLAGDDNPFVEHRFLAALEASGSVGARDTGWVPRIVTAWLGSELVGAVPLYEKLDSYGEYIFDWGWAQAAERAGLRYYPKLVAAVPFTPVTGPRVLLAPSLDAAGREATAQALFGEVRAVARDLDASSVHVLFCTEAEQQLLGRHDYLPRASYQFHWENTGAWTSWDDYLGAMRSRLRKQTSSERRRAAALGLHLSVRRGPELGRREWDALWAFYQDTGSRKWGTPYLTRQFFLDVERHLQDRVVCAFAHDGDLPVAGTLMFHKGGHLYGRYWGALRELDCMHFELCYYRPIEWCLQNGLRRFEAGAQGEHKLRRGLLPSSCFSAHQVLRPGLAEAVARALPREADAVAQEMEVLAEHGPFRR